MFATCLQDSKLGDSNIASRNVTLRFPVASIFPISLNEKGGRERKKRYFCSIYLTNARNCV